VRRSVIRAGRRSRRDPVLPQSIWHIWALRTQGHPRGQSRRSFTRDGSLSARRPKTHPTSQPLVRRDLSAPWAGRAQLPGAQRAGNSPTYGHRYGETALRL